MKFILGVGGFGGGIYLIWNKIINKQKSLIDFQGLTCNKVFSSCFRSAIFAAACFSAGVCISPRDERRSLSLDETLAPVAIIDTALWG